MLPAELRITRSEDFARVIRSGGRAGRRTLVAHLLLAPDDARPARAGLVVSKAVGGSVVRHRVSRRLRHLLLAELSQLPDGSLLVVRALGPAAEADSVQLGADLGKAVRAARQRTGGGRQTGTEGPAGTRRNKEGHS